MNRFYTLICVMFLSQLAIGQSRFVPFDGLIAYYMLDGNAGDSSGNNNNGTTTAAPASMNRYGQAGKAVYFNGTSSSISVPNSGSLQPGNGVSVSAWVKPDSISTAGAVISKRASLSADPYHSYALIYNPNRNRWSFAKSSGTPGSLKQLPAKTVAAWSTWVFLAGTYDGTTMKLYVNGVLDTSFADAGGLGFGAVPMFIGYSGSGSEYFKGSIDDVAVHNRALTASEITSMFNGTVGVNEASREIEFSVYPNPAENQLQINGHAFIQYTITDMAGKSIASGACSNQIDISSLHSGMYCITLTDDLGNTGVKHFVRK